MCTREGIGPLTQILVLCGLGLCQSPYGTTFIWFLQPNSICWGPRLEVPCSTCLHLFAPPLLHWSHLAPGWCWATLISSPSLLKVRNRTPWRAAYSMCETGLQGLA